MSTFEYFTEEQNVTDETIQSHFHSPRWRFSPGLMMRKHYLSWTDTYECCFTLNKYCRPPVMYSFDPLQYTFSQPL